MQSPELAREIVAHMFKAHQYNVMGFGFSDHSIPAGVLPDMLRGGGWGLEEWVDLACRAAPFSSVLTRIGDHAPDAFYSGAFGRTLANGEHVLVQGQNRFCSNGSRG